MNLKTIATYAIPLAIALTALTGCNQECCCDSDCARKPENTPVKSADHTLKATDRTNAIRKVESALMNSLVSLSVEDPGDFFVPGEGLFDRDSDELKYIALWRSYEKPPDGVKEELVNLHIKLEYQNRRWVCLVTIEKGRESKFFMDTLIIYLKRADLEVIVKKPVAEHP